MNIVPSNKRRLTSVEKEYADERVKLVQLVVTTTTNCVLDLIVALAIDLKPLLPEDSRAEFANNVDLLQEQVIKFSDTLATDAKPYIVESIKQTRNKGGITGHAKMANLAYTKAIESVKEKMSDRQIDMVSQFVDRIKSPNCDNSELFDNHQVDALTTLLSNLKADKGDRYVVPLRELIELYNMLIENIM